MGGLVFAIQMSLDGYMAGAAQPLSSGVVLLRYGRALPEEEA